MIPKFRQKFNKIDVNEFGIIPNSFFFSHLTVNIVNDTIITIQQASAEWVLLRPQLVLFGDQLL